MNFLIPKQPRPKWILFNNHFPPFPQNTRSSLTVAQWNYGDTTKEGTNEFSGKHSKEEKPKKSLGNLLYQLSDTNPFRQEVNNRSQLGNLSQFKLVEEMDEEKHERANPWSRSMLVQQTSLDDSYDGLAANNSLEPHPAILKGKGRGIILNENKELNLSKERKPRSSGRGKLLPE